MPRPEQQTITFTLDGREVSAPENIMLADGARYGDVEIPVFCYEPKLGQPVGACRMCLVEIEGIPKLQSACSTPVKDGMVVNTQTERVREAQQAVVEFLLVNHPLDCPVCDKGGECPLQDITFGWGAGRSRFIEPKRHFQKPLDLSPLVAIDRERCILCYRCVRYSQEVSEDHQLVLLERGEHSYVGTFDSRPYVAPFSANIVELCPVGALTSTAYRFRARPWEIEGAGSICTLCPAQCNVTLTVRDERVLRVLARDNAGVDDGWLCDVGRFAYQAITAEERVTEPLVREHGELVPASWERALDAAAAALSKAKGRVAALAGGGATNEEGFLLARMMREALHSPDVAHRPGAARPTELERALAAPALQASVPDVEFAHALLVLDCDPIDDAPIIDLRIRKGVRRRGVKLAVASSRPSALDGGATVAARYAPGAGEAFVAALDAALRGDEGVEALAAAAGADAAVIRELAELLSGGGEDVVIVWGERLGYGERGPNALRALLNVAHRLGLAAAAGAGLLELPSAANGRGLREACGASDGAPRGAAEIAQALADGALGALYLLDSDPLRTHPDRALWERALDAAGAVVAHESLLSETARAHATVVFPAESYAEKEGTVTHPDGRVQRLRPAIGRPGSVRAEWQVLAELAKRLGHDLDVLSGPMATAALVEATPTYSGITLDALAGQGIRWPAGAGTAAAPAGAAAPFSLEAPAAAPEPDGALRLGTYRPIWACSEVEASPALHFAIAEQRVELAPADAQRLGIADGDAVEVAVNGSLVRGTAALRAALPAGSVFLAEGTAAEAANALTVEAFTLVEVRPA